MKASNKRKLLSSVFDLTLTAIIAIVLYLTLPRLKFLSIFGTIEYVLLLHQTLCFVYFLFFYIITAGRSPGRILFCNRVVSENGARMNLRQIILRSLLQCILVLQVANAFYQLYNKEKEAIYSVATGTIVINTKKKELRMK